jgi:hypothetical protein
MSNALAVLGGSYGLLSPIRGLGVPQRAGSILVVMSSAARFFAAGSGRWGARAGAGGGLRSESETEEKRPGGRGGRL